MQNKEHELRKLISDSDQRSDSYNSDPAHLQTNQLEHNIPTLAVPQSQEKQTVFNGCPPNHLLPSQNNQVPTQLADLKDTVTYDYARMGPKDIEAYADAMLDQITLSDEEGEDAENVHGKLSEKDYNHEMKKITAYYNEEDEADSMNKYTGTKNEVEERKEIPVPFLTETDSVMIEAGKVDTIVENKKVIIRADVSTGILDLDNILFNVNKIPIGYIDDAIGNIDNPLYVLNFFPNISEADRTTLAIADQPLFYVQDKAKLINYRSLTSKKGCDASNAFDEEIPEGEMEFSDDEKEREKKKEKRSGNAGHKKPRTEDMKPGVNNTSTTNGYLEHIANNTKNAYNANKSGGYHSGNLNNTQTPGNIQGKSYKNEPDYGIYSQSHSRTQTQSLAPNMNTNYNQNQNMFNPCYTSPYTFGVNNQPNYNIPGMSNPYAMMYGPGAGMHNNGYPPTGMPPMNQFNQVNPMQPNYNTPTTFNSNTTPGNNLNVFMQQMNPFVKPDLNNGSFNMNINGSTNLN